MARSDVFVAGTLILFGTGLATVACTSTSSISANGQDQIETNPTCLNNVQDTDETGVDCGGSCVSPCGPDGRAITPHDANGVPFAPTATDKQKDGTETDVDCGGPGAPKCADGQACATDSDCVGACNYDHKCVSAPSCATHLGGDTCGLGEVGASGTQHESCCRSLPVAGFNDPKHPGKTVYLDKYEITAGRVRQWIKQMSAMYGGKPNVKQWVAEHRPEVWDPAWDKFLPEDMEGPTIVINRRLLGDPRPEDAHSTDPPGPGVILPPATDQTKHLGINYQFGSEVYVDLHGSDCATWNGSYGFPTYYYPNDVLARDGQLPRATATGYAGETLQPADFLDAKSMNCIPNEMLVAFCAWDGGQLATDEVLDFVTQTPPSLGFTSGCGVQYDNHGELLGNNYSHTVQTGGQCAPVIQVNATFDAGDNLPQPGSPLNTHNYHYPDLGAVTHDKVWEVGAPGRASLSPAANGTAVDVVRLHPGDEPWMDLNGNLSESALDTTSGNFSGNFTMKYRGIGYGSARSDLNTTMIQGETVLRLQRPEAKAAYLGGRCMRFK